jgi:hypothetical protein
LPVGPPFAQGPDEVVERGACLMDRVAHDQAQVARDGRRVVGPLDDRAVVGVIRLDPEWAAVAVRLQGALQFPDVVLCTRDPGERD